MFNSLVYIPTILAYTFISLLVVILGFIVIYVTHKIYTTIYDNLPVAQLSSKSIIPNQLKTMTQSTNILNLGTKTDAQLCRKSKTALRIIVTLEPCYLVFMVFESILLKPYSNSTSPCQISSSFNSQSSTSTTDSQESLIESYLLIKYFDSLATIPTGRDLHMCNILKFNNMPNYNSK